MVFNAGWIKGLPYIYTINDSNTDEISGVNYDLASSLANKCNFSLHLDQVDVYGALQSDGSWTGIVEKLMTKKLDLGIADISITIERANVIDFSIGIHDTEYVLFMRQSGQVLQWKTFIQVFSPGFWCCMISFIISLTIFLCIIKISSSGTNIND